MTPDTKSEEINAFNFEAEVCTDCKDRKLRSGRRVGGLFAYSISTV